MRQKLAFTVLVIYVFLLAVAGAALFAAEPPQVLLIQRAYDGPVETTGVLNRWVYSGGSMLVDWTDTTTDGIFRSGFEAL